MSSNSKGLESKTYKSMASTSKVSTSEDSKFMDSTSMDSTSMDSTSMDSTSMDSTPMDSTSMDSTSMDSTPMDSTSMDSTPIDSTSMDSASAEILKAPRSMHFSPMASTSMNITLMAFTSIDSTPMAPTFMPDISMDFISMPDTMDSTSPQPFDPEKESRNKISMVAEMFDEVIEANKSLDKMYEEQENILIKKQAIIRAELELYKKQSPVKKPKQEVFRYCSVGRPYFKDKNFESPPDNEDTEIMKMWDMYDFSNVMAVAGWTVGDKARLMAILVDLAKDFVRGNIYEEMTQLQLSKTKDEACLARIAELKQELFELKDKELENLNLPEKLDFDWQEIAAKLNKRHTAREYKAIWDLFFHPRVNKKSWTPYEHIKLQRIVSEKGNQNWEAIAEAMGTNRTGYQCFVYYRTNVSHAASGRKWTQSEISFLEKLISLYKEQNYIPWGRVAASMPNRTKIQCYNKYLRMIEKRKGRFLPEEDAVILNFAKKYGTDFRRMSQFLAGRSAVQLRVRYGLLKKLRVSATWSVEDDRKLLQIMAHQDSNSNFSDATAYFPGKDRQHIRSRYNTLMRWMKCHPHSDVSTAPRRAARRLPYGAASSSLVESLAILRDRMEDELQNPKAPKVRKKLSKLSSENTIHDAIMSTIANLESNRVVSNRTQKAKDEDSYKIMEVEDISSTPEEQLNQFNTKHFLITLNAKIDDQAKFYSSEIGQKFKELEGKKPPEMGKIRSYSKVEKHVSVELDFTPDLFGNTAGRRFLLPPNFASLTGSRIILNYQGYLKERADMNVKALARRNIGFRKALNDLHDRFVDIFTWPYVLSNLSPEYFQVSLEDVKKTHAKGMRPGHIALPDVPAVTIPPPPPRRLRLKTNAEGIDVPTTEVDVNIEPNFSGVNLGENK